MVPIVARYRPLLELGRGGTARVYLSESLTSGLKKLVVLKTLEPSLSQDTEMRDLFRREAEVCARLNHPNIVQVHEIVEQPAGPVIVMEYVEGVSLSQVMKMSEGRFPKRLHLHTLTQLLAGLHYFHELKDYDRRTELKPVHRDVSPQNVIVMYEGAVKVLDFGIAKLANQEQATATGIVKGKLHYMPAEQLLSDSSLDRRADIFSVGVMLWEALAGRRMWRGMSENDIFQALLRDQMPSLRSVVPDLPEHFYQVVLKATAHNKEDRYATALEMQLDVEKMLGELGGLVHTRELAAFMQAEFADWRKKQETAVMEAAEHPVEASWGVSGTRVYTEQELQSREVSQASGVSIARAEPAYRRFWIPVLVLAVAALAVALFFALRRKPVPQVASASVSGPVVQQMVSISVSSNPVGALVVLDGTPLGRTPWQGKLPARPETGTLELRADNCEPLSKVIALNEDVAIEVHLTPLPSSSSPVSSASASPTSEKKPSGGARPVRPTGVKPAAKNPDCNPPFTLSPDGIRVYKPECFK
jgi:serine/threonine-protein kinase